MWSLTTLRVSRPTCILVGRGVTERSFRRRFEPDRERRLRLSLLGRSGDEAVPPPPPPPPPVLVCLFSLSLSRSTLPRRSVRSLDLGRTGLLTSFGGASLVGGLGERVAVLRLVVRRSPPLLDEEDELDEDELLLDELDRDPELLRDELLSEELPLLSLLLELLRFLRSFSRPRCFCLSFSLSESGDSERFFERAIILHEPDGIGVERMDFQRKTPKI